MVNKNNVVGRKGTQIVIASMFCGRDLNTKFPVTTRKKQGILYMPNTVNELQNGRNKI